MNDFIDQDEILKGIPNNYDDIELILMTTEDSILFVDDNGEILESFRLQ